MTKKDLAYMDRAAAVVAEPENAVGRIKKAYGNGKDGALLATLYDNFPVSAYAASVDTENCTEPLWVVIDSLAVPLFIASLEVRGAKENGKAVMRFDDFDEEATAALLVGKTLYVAGGGEAADEEQEPGIELVGFELLDRASGRRGVVRAFYDYPGNPLLGVDFDGREVLVPAVEGVIEVANARRRKLEGDLPEGLFDL